MSDVFSQTAEDIGNTMSWSSVMLLIGLSASQIVLQSSLESMWVLVNANQLISFMPLMSVSFPPNTLILFKLLAFFNGDIYLL